MADNKNIVGAYVGTEEVSKIYLGTDLLYDSTPPVTTNKTLVIIGVEDGIQGGQHRGCGISNIFDFFSVWNDVEEQVDNSLDVYPPFSGSYERHDSTNTITLVGPFTASSYTLNCYGPIDTCTNINNDVTVQFSGDTAEVYCDYTSPEPDLECECVSAGGEWDAENEECIYPEPDPCAEYGSQEECDCVQNGGTWVVPEIGDPYCEQGGDVDCEGDPECECVKAGGTWGEGYCDCAGDPECECVSAGGEWDGSDCIYP